MKPTLSTLISEGRTIISDGAWGTLLQEKGLKPGECPELWNIEHMVDEALADETWRAPAEVNRRALFDAGLWGAPSYCVNGRPAHWGQDRLWALEEDLLEELTRP